MILVTDPRPSGHELFLRSGGQTGVDRAALDVALDLGVRCGGWCPAGRRAEDGRISDRYPLLELPGAGYRQRTCRNVLDSDGTVIFHFAGPSGGTRHTLEDCRRSTKPCLLIDAAVLTPREAVTRLDLFVRESLIADLNVAGPRASEEESAYGYAQAALRLYLRANMPNP